MIFISIKAKRTFSEVFHKMGMGFTMNYAIDVQLLFPNLYLGYSDIHEFKLGQDPETCMDEYLFTFPSLFSLN